jgi:cytochrome c oxidase assembly factor 1
MRGDALIELVYPFLGESARVHFISKRVGQKWSTQEFSVVRKSDNKAIDIGVHDLTETGEPVVSA